MKNLEIQLPAMDEIMLRLAEIDSKIESLKNEKIFKKGLLNTKEAANALQITTRHLQNLRDRGDIGFVQYGRNVRFRPEHLDAYIEMHTISARSHLNRVA